MKMRFNKVLEEKNAVLGDLEIGDLFEYNDICKNPELSTIYMVIFDGPSPSRHKRQVVHLQTGKVGELDNTTKVNKVVGTLEWRYSLS